MKIIILVLPFLLVGCASLFAPQELSENYALLPGVECNAPQAVDGDMNTISNDTRIVISLPEKKSIRRIIIHNTNISNFIVYEYLGEKGAWKIITSVKGNKEAKIVLNTHIVTDKIRLFVSDTSGSRFIGPGVVIGDDGFFHKTDTQRDVKPEIQEIELYGLVDIVGKPKAKGAIF